MKKQRLTGRMGGFGLAAAMTAGMLGTSADAETAAEKLGWQLAVHSYTFQKFRGAFCVEYEHNRENSAPEIAACAKFFHSTCEQLVAGQ